MGDRDAEAGECGEHSNSFQLLQQQALLSAVEVQSLKMGHTQWATHSPLVPDGAKARFCSPEQDVLGLSDAPNSLHSPPGVTVLEDELDL